MDWHDRHAAARWDAAESAKAREELEPLLDALERAGPRSVLELGVGTGLVAERVLARLPEARLTGIDTSAAMLERARERLAAFGGRVALVEGDLGAPDELELGGGSFDAALAVQSLHHVDDAAKQRLFPWLGRVLDRGALLLVYDRVPHHAHGDLHPAPPEAQLTWLGTAGFEAEILGDALLAATRR